MMKKLTLVFSLLLVLTTTSCLGPNRAMNSMNSVNSELTESKWLNELLFIIPFYWVGQIALLGDVLIFNSIEWWGGDNPISEPRPFQSQADM